MRKFDTQVQFLKYKVLRETAHSGKDNKKSGSFPFW